MVKFQAASNSIIGYGSSELAKSDKNDCFVRAVASATEVPYDAAHEYVEAVFNRANGRAVVFSEDKLAPVETNGMLINEKGFNFKVLGRTKLTNTYKLHGEYIRRKKTVKSFIKDNPKGTFILGVSKHAFTLKDGILIDNKDEEFRPTRKVQSAFLITPVLKDAQLSLF